MNILDIDQQSLTIFSFDSILKRQRILLDEYIKFDKDVSFGYDNIDDADTQRKIKLLFWRIIEELGEYYHAKETMHQFEELIDSFHFALELMILIKIKDDDLIKIFNDAILDKSVNILEVVMKYANAGNFLKNKTWKRTQMETDEDVFKIYLKDCFASLSSFIYMMLGEKFYEIYDRKSLINLFRIRSKY